MPGQVVTGIVTQEEMLAELRGHLRADANFSDQRHIVKGVLVDVVNPVSVKQMRMAAPAI